MSNKKINGISRREFLKGAAASAGVIALSQIPGLAQEKPFSGETVKWLIGPGHNLAAYRVYAEDKEFRKNFGITVKPITAPTDKHYDLCVKDWQAGGGEYDLVTLRPAWNGEFMRGKYLIKLGDYFDKYDFWDDYKDAIAQYRKLYTQWAGEVRAVVQDGDITPFYFRNDVLEDPDYRKQFADENGYELPSPPETWDQLLDVAKFFNGKDWDGDGKKEFGFAFFPLKRQFVDIPVNAMFASLSGGKLPFDKDFNPNFTQNLDASVRMLKIYRELLGYMPPGWLGATFGQSFAAFVTGDVPMAINFGDIGRFALNPGTFGGEGNPELKPKIDYSVWPGTYHNGKLYRYASAAYGRIIGITKFAKNPEAAFQILTLVAGKESSLKHISNLNSGDDPYSQYQLESARRWTINVEQDYLDAIKANLGIAVPDIFVPGFEEYMDALRGPIHSYLAEGGDEEAVLKKIEKEWEKITDRRGYASQLSAWEDFLETARALGFKV